jgi:hypothetical protein
MRPACLVQFHAQAIPLRACSDDLQMGLAAGIHSRRQSARRDPAQARNDPTSMGRPDFDSAARKEVNRLRKRDVDPLGFDVVVHFIAHVNEGLAERG